MTPAIIGFYFFSTGTIDALQDPIYEVTQGAVAPGKGEGHAGAFGHWTYGLTDSLSVDLTGVSSLIAPDPAVRYRWFEKERWTIDATAGFSVPTYGLRLLQGTVLPGDQEIPWAVVPGLGSVVGWHGDAWTASLGMLGRVGVTFGSEEGDLRSFAAADLAWLDPMVAPITEGWSVAWLPSLEWHGSEKWQFQFQTRMQFSAGPDFNLRLLGWRHLGEHHSLSAGAVVANEAMTFGRAIRWAPRVDWRYRF